MDLALINTVLNTASIIAWLAVFYVALTRGNIVTRRENTLTLKLKDEQLALKDQVIAAKDETIAEQRAQIAAFNEVGDLLRAVLTALHDRGSS